MARGRRENMLVIEGSKGRIWAYPACDVAELGVSVATSSTDQIVSEFLRQAGAVALEWTEMRKGVLLFQTTQSMSSAAICVYNRQEQHFYCLQFERGSVPL